MKANNKQILIYVSQFKNLYNGKPWYGDPLVNLLETVSETDAFAQTASNAHSIAQILWHMIYWRQLLIKRLEPDPDFKASMDSPDNWRSNEQLKSMGWTALQTGMGQSQASLLRLLKKQKDTLLKKEFKKGSSFDKLVEGIVQHDIYHAGQIGLLKNLVKVKA